MNDQSDSAKFDVVQTSGRFCVGRGKTSPEPGQENMQGTPDAMGDTLRKHLFKRFSFLRSTAFRMGVTFWLLFTLCFGAAEYGFYRTLESRLLQKIDESITERYEHVSRVYEEKGADGVVDIAQWRSKSPMDSGMGFHFADADGIRIAGNVPAYYAEPGWSTLSGNELGLESDLSQYRFFTDNLDNNVLSIGRSLEDVLELRQTALYCLLWTSALSVLLAIVVAWFFARRVHNRVHSLSQALNGVAAGNLNARLPVTCAYDDIDEFAVKINDSLDRLKQTVDSMRQVSTDIAHDLKTPLNRLFITVDDAASKSRSGQCVGDDLDVAVEEIHAINGTFEALLRIAQIEAGARKSQFKHFDLAEVLSTAVEVYAPVVEESCQELQINIPVGKSLPMLGDKDLMLQLVVNLIENAVHHCTENTNIVISAGQDGEIVWFDVADSGLGIPDDEREKVFQRLYRLERSRTTRGTGLGLSMVKAISDLHCGTISLEDNRPGLRFAIRFDRNCPLDS